ncbi:STM2901 family protein [Rahnella victoriana]|uniref:STM2901 family protein n=1 Tax=Rahnella victoriana TaxID=1510570 RepID=UPI00103F9B9F|nr:hypothetical protein [Rahnella victoriana]TBX32798.1 hypothetical protein EYY67_17365 [Rahnella victoriana]
MDTVEELKGTYFYKGVCNISAGELFFWIFLDEIGDQFGGITDLGAMALIILGQPVIATRGKIGLTTKGTSVASLASRRYLNYTLPFQLPTFTNQSIRTLKPMFVNNLGAFVGRAVPVVGWVLIASDVATIAYKTTSHYNKIARGNDKIW